MFLHNEKVRRVAKVFWMGLTLFSVVGVLLSGNKSESPVMMYTYICLMWVGNRIFSEGIDALFPKQEEKQK